MFRKKNPETSDAVLMGSVTLLEWAHENKADSRLLKKELEYFPHHSKAGSGGELSAQYYVPGAHLVRVTAVSPCILAK